MRLMKAPMLDERERRRLEVGERASVPCASTNSERALLGEEAFASMLYLERRRAERAKKRFVLMVVDVERVIAQQDSERILPRFTSALTTAIRETDIIGWYIEDNL